MKTIVFCIFNYQGELNGTLNLAKKLKQLGHQVYYLGLVDSEHKVHSHGFQFLTILEEWFPRNFMNQMNANNLNLNGYKLILSQIKYIKLIKRAIDSLVNKNNREIHLLLKETKPDLLLISTTEGAYATFMGLIAHECKIKSIYLTDIVREDCHYAEASIDFDRDKPHFPWSKLDHNKTIIYCSLGTTSGTFETLNIKKAKIFFQIIIKATSLRKEYQLVLSVGEYIDPQSFDSVPDDVVIVNKAPQLDLLEKVSLAIIAGGIHTVKECIFCGVPMIIFPVWADQPENAERVEHHGLGLIANIESISTKLVIDLIEKIESNFVLKNTVKEWNQKFRESENSGKAIEFISKTLALNS